VPCALSRITPAPNSRARFDRTKLTRRVGMRPADLVAHIDDALKAALELD
jgi:hypothetical protein